MKIKTPNINTQAVKMRVAKAGITAGLITSALIVASVYFDTYAWSYQSPIVIKLQSPLIVSKRDKHTSPIPEVKAAEPVITPTATPTPEASTVSELVKGIHKLESSEGRNKAGLAGYCESLGKTNEYGYRPYAKHCFNTKAEARAKVSEWVTIHLDKFAGDEGMAMCYYNTGEAVSQCEYYTNYLKMKGI